MKNINHAASKKMLGFHYETVIMLLSEMEKRHIIRNMDDCNNMEIHYDSKTGTTGIYVDELHFFENGRRYDRTHVLFLDEYGEIVEDVPRPIRQEMSIWILGTEFNRLFTNRTIPDHSDEFRFFKIKD